jgi:hypothetical protein
MKPLHSHGGKSQDGEPLPGRATGVTPPAPKTPADPAVLIGLTVAFARQGGISGGRAAAVPAPVLKPLEAAARGGCGASAMVIDWLSRRGGIAVPSSHTKANAKAREASNE